MTMIQSIICRFKGHIVDPEENIVNVPGLDKRNWICRCHRCGMYLMHEGVYTNGTIVMNKSEAMRTKEEFEYEMRKFLDDVNQ
jgi:hypothetical protein